MSRKSDPFAVELTPELILRAYRAGIFPMAEDAESPDLFWVSPQRRGVIPLDNFHLSRSLKQKLRHHGFTVKVDTDFAGIIEGCATEGTDRDTTWINPAIRRLYGELFARGYVHTVEVWDGTALVGGLYGVSIGAAFFGESMFHRVTDCSKIAMAHLLARLRAGNYLLLDTQFITSHLKTFGGEEIARSDYELRLSDALAHEADWTALDRSTAPLPWDAPNAG